MSSPVRLIHWNAEDARVRAATIRVAGFEVVYDPFTPTMLNELRDDPTAVIVIDLSRLPSQGRDLALRLRQTIGTRHIPIVFADGEPAKVAKIREALPDAIYTSWKEIKNVLAEALANPPADPVVPESVFAAYAGSPLIKKLGIKPATTVAVINAPEDFMETLGELPEGVRFVDRPEAGIDMAIWFIRSAEELRTGIEWVREHLGPGGIWVAWPKKSSGVRSDLSQETIRDVANSAGMVDYKISAIDDTWSAMRITLRVKL